MRSHGVPPHLINIVGDYFWGRTLADRDEVQCERSIVCGVPQGSVLGSLLWDLAYDEVLLAALPPGVTVIGYADDTIVVVGAETWQEGRQIANLAVTCVVRVMSRLGLRVARQKTEALYFHDGTHGVPPRVHLEVAGTRVLVGTHLKYLGLHLDGKWNFHGHFDHLAPRMISVANSLGRLLPNLEGPDTRVRRLYAGVVHAVALYGAPVWAGEAAGSRRIQTLMRRAQRRVAIRVARAQGPMRRLRYWRDILRWNFWRACMQKSIEAFEDFGRRGLSPLGYGQQ